MSYKQYAACPIKHLSDTQLPTNSCVYTFSSVLPEVWSLFLHLVFSEWCKNTRNLKHNWCKDCDAEWQSALNMLFWLFILLKRFHGLETSLFKSDGFTGKTLQSRETVSAFSLCLCWSSPWVTVIMANMDIHSSIKYWTEITNLFDELWFSSHQREPVLALVIKFLQVIFFPH